jgi:hypothetical protein
MTKKKHKLGDLPPVVRAALGRYVEAKVADSWKGGGDPADWPAIEQHLRAARADMVRILKAHLKG